MQDIQKKDFVFVIFAFAALIFAFSSLYFKEGWFKTNVVENEKTQEEIIFEYTPVDQEKIGEICPKTFVDQRDGQEYSVVQIGEQCWMGENLNYEHEDSVCYENQGLYCCYYTWYTAMEACPVGWELPSDDEWKVLEMQLGMSAKEANKMDTFRHSFVENAEIGGMLKSETFWEQPNECFGKCNTVFFSAMPCGYIAERASVKRFLGERAYFWTATEGEMAGGFLSRGFHHLSPGLDRSQLAALHGFSVRCLMEKL